MFYYYGAKHRLAVKYPAPIYRHIIEPFAGAAGYSCYWAERDPDLHFTLIEKDGRVAELWQRLLHDNTPLPAVPAVGEYTTDFLVMTTAASNAMGKAKRLKVTPRVVTEYERMIRRIERVRPLMKGRTTVIVGDYRLADAATWGHSRPSTWFIDPPYQPPVEPVSTSSPRGKGYAAGCDNRAIDYKDLALWAQARQGQVIVCEQEGATWLPFVRLAEHQNGSGRKAMEMIWTNAGKEHP